MKRLMLVLGLVLTTRLASGAECTDDWSYYFDTDPLHPKVISGDSSAGYAIYAFWGDPSLKIEIHGEFPRARFMSFETESTRFPVSVDALFDSAIEPDAGSENPFRNGVALDTPARAYTVIASAEKPEGAVNTVRLPGGRLINALMFRIYRPNRGVTLTARDLPRLFARDSKTGEPVACPRPASRPVRWHFPQFLADGYAATHPFEFSDPGQIGFLGMNSAAKYLYALTEMTPGDVLTARFKAPTFVDTTEGTGRFDDRLSNVRYWSFCTNNFPNNEGLNCLPDLLAPVHSDGFAYVAVGTGAAAEAEAKRRGYAFLPDARSPRQRVMALVYRNLVPSPEFKAEQMYQGDYKPEPKRCSGSDFLSGGCGW